MELHWGNQYKKDTLVLIWWEKSCVAEFKKEKEKEKVYQSNRRKIQGLQS